MGLFTDERLTMDVENLKTDVKILKEHRIDCDDRHEQHQIHRRRLDDAINHNTIAQKQLSESIDTLNGLIHRIIERVDGGQPQIDFIKDWRTTFSNNTRLLSGLFWLLAGVSTTVGVYLLVKSLL